MTLEPGIYKATVRGVPDQIVTVDDDGLAGHTAKFLRGSSSGNYRHHPIDTITDARPLIVLDLETPVHYARILRHAAARGSVIDGVALENLANQIEAQVKPPRIPEPGLWGVVKASVPFNGWRTAYLHDDTNPGAAVWSSLHGRVAWADLIDPVLIRDGIET